MSIMQGRPASNHSVEDGAAFVDLRRLIDEYCQSYELGESPWRRRELFFQLIDEIEQNRTFSSGTRKIKLGNTIYSATRSLDGLVVYAEDLNGHHLHSVNKVSRLMRLRDTPLNRLLDEIEEEVRNVEYEHVDQCRVKDERWVDRPSRAIDLLRHMADRLPGQKRSDRIVEAPKDPANETSMPPTDRLPNQRPKTDDGSISDPPNSDCPRRARNAWNLLQFGRNVIPHFDTIGRVEQHTRLKHYLESNLENDKYNTHEIQRLLNLLDEKPDTWAHYLRKAGVKRYGMRVTARSAIARNQA